MSDKITLDRIQLLHPKLREEAGHIYSEICSALTGRATCRFAYTLRTDAEQTILYNQGRTTPGKIVTNAKAGQSMHGYGLAVDIVLLIDEKTASWDMKTDFDADGKADWIEIVEIFKRYGWSWGGNWAHFPDYPHFEKSFGYSLMDLQKLKQNSTNPYINL